MIHTHSRFRGHAAFTVNLGLIPRVAPPSPRIGSWLVAFIICMASRSIAVAQPIALHPTNPHYFLWHDQAVALITSGEHYGSVLNLDFDYRRYLDTLAADGMMLTRTMSGTYLEPPQAFNIAKNTLAPAAERFICPWARSNEPGFAHGGNKVDLTKWEEAYFVRLHDFMRYAATKDVVVEFTLFCPMYEDMQWNLSPMNARNNVNQVGAIGRNDVHTLDKNGPLLAIQEALVRKLITELNVYDNVMFEICNEPYFGGVTMAWQHHIADLIVETEKSLPKKHLITQNIANNQALIEQPHPRVSVFNFHYASPPDTVGMNYGLQKVIGDNETGFRGIENMPYRTEAWDFMIAGGGLFNHLDYSFTVGHEDGTFEFPPTQPGGGGKQLRREFKILRDFLHGFDLTRLRPDNSIIRGGVPASGSARAIVDPERAIAIYIRNADTAGPWSARWTGFMEAPRSGPYLLHLTSNDGVRLSIDDKLVIDNWTEHSEHEDSARVEWQAGQRYAVKLEYFYNGGDGITRWEWTPPSGTREVVPANAFRLKAASQEGGWGLRGAYFHGTDLKDAWSTRDDGIINFAWGHKPPFRRDTAATAASSHVNLEVALPAGKWQAIWIDTVSGMKTSPVILDGGAVVTLASPAFRDDVALQLVKVGTNRSQ